MRRELSFKNPLLAEEGGATAGRLESRNPRLTSPTSWSGVRSR